MKLKNPTSVAFRYDKYVSRSFFTLFGSPTHRARPYTTYSDAITLNVPVLQMALVLLWGCRAAQVVPDGVFQIALLWWKEIPTANTCVLPPPQNCCIRCIEAKLIVLLDR